MKKIRVMFSVILFLSTILTIFVVCLIVLCVRLKKKGANRDGDETIVSSVKRLRREASFSSSFDDDSDVDESADENEWEIGSPTILDFRGNEDTTRDNTINSVVNNSNSLIAITESIVTNVNNMVSITKKAIGEKEEELSSDDKFDLANTKSDGVENDDAFNLNNVEVESGEDTSRSSDNVGVENLSVDTTNNNSIVFSTISDRGDIATLTLDEKIKSTETFVSSNSMKKKEEIPIPSVGKFNNVKNLCFS